MAVCLVLALLLAVGASAAWAQDHEEQKGDSESRFSDEPIPLADIPKRPRPLLELGEPFLG